ncbi:hypothetical protein PIROE2DRAFT_18492 [Piromyces sp. E2]|nr:hypothetical protein PIROE2DRAFT_18492 [Piromyces sp. E2]|eukprot:OUM56762.1 hypothetical protein PIROE2DRAFT_18492 [Piromyces sp. E2]
MYGKKIYSIISLIAISGISKTLASAVNPTGMVACGSLSTPVTDFDTKGPCDIATSPDTKTY